MIPNLTSVNVGYSEYVSGYEYYDYAIHHPLKLKLNSDFESAYNELKNDSHIDTAFTTYQEKVSEIFNNHAPLKKSIIIARPNTKWYSEKIRQEKTKRRRLERKKDKSGLQQDNDCYIKQCKC